MTPPPSPPYRIALCITELDVGGAERCCAELAARVDRARFEPVVYALGEPRLDLTRTVVPRLQSAHVPVVFLCGRNWRDAPGVVSRLTRQLREQRPALVQSFLFHANFLSRIAARRAGIPHQVSGIRVAERASRWHLTLDRLTSRWVDRFVCVSQAVADFSARQGHLPAEKLSVIGNGVDLATFDAATAAVKKTSAGSERLGSFGIAPGQRVAIAVGRLEPQKGFDRLGALASRFSRELAGWSLLLVGEGPQRRELEDLFRAAGMAERVHFAGWQADVPRLLAASDLFLLPSRWEGMPNALLEAMAAGLPAVCTEVEGVRDILGPLATGQIAPADGEQAFANAVASMATDVPHRADLGRQNRDRVAAHFSLDAMALAYQSLWEALIRGQPRP